MKTSLAAMLVATETFIRDFGASLQGGIAFLITSDEEGVATHGTKAVMEWLDERDQTFDYAIVGEPSSHEKLGDVIRVGRRGSLNGTIKLDGAIGHVAYADDTPNPIHSIISALSPLVERQWDEGNEMFIPTTFQISNIHAGTGAENVIPAEVDVKFNFRFNTEHTPEQLQTDVENALEAINHTIDTRVEWRLSGSPFLSKQGNLTDTVADQIQKHTGLIPQKSTSGGTSDARFLVPKGIETVELGPVNRSIHKFDEHVAVKEFEPLARIYHDTLVALLT